jgi:malonyl CoA-acyl carrier protein transacylase
MAAVLGVPGDAVEARLAEVRSGIVEIANWNSDDQIVISGDKIAVEPFDQVSGALETRIRDERLARQTKDWVRDLRKRANIQIKKDCLK